VIAELEEFGSALRGKAVEVYILDPSLRVPVVARLRVVVLPPTLGLDNCSAAKHAASCCAAAGD